MESADHYRASDGWSARLIYRDETIPEALDWGLQSGQAELLEAGPEGGGAPAGTGCSTASEGTVSIAFYCT
jgi:hypothetical protein